VGIFETSMAVALAITLLILLVPPHMRTGPLAGLEITMPVFAAVAFQIHAFVEGPVRALLPAYVVGFVLLIVTVLRFLYLRPSRPPIEPPAMVAPTSPASGSQASLPRNLELGGALLGLSVLGWTFLAR
jgi:hypothetical protein